MINLPKAPQPEFSPKGDLLNWIEIETFHRHNSPTWDQAFQYSKSLRWNEVDRLRVLCANLSVEVEHYRDIAFRAAVENPSLIINQ